MRKRWRSNTECLLKSRDDGVAGSAFPSVWLAFGRFSRGFHSVVTLHTPDLDRKFAGQVKKDWEELCLVRQNQPYIKLQCLFSFVRLAFAECDLYYMPIPDIKVPD